MDNRTYIQHLLQKFALNQCTPQELAQVHQYFKNNGHADDLPSVEEVLLMIADKPEMPQQSADRIFSGIIQKTQQEEQQPKMVRFPFARYAAIAAIAASLVVMLGAGWYFAFRPGAAIAPIIDPNQITLQLEDGSIQVIAEDGTVTIKDANNNIIASQDKASIAYDKESNVEELVYNTLRIPYGKKFNLKLSDGTVVHLNSGTTLKFPVKFLPGQQRTVFLDGEAYFDVAKDKAHPFMVNADKAKIQVLGTRFNVSNYPEDDFTDVVLEEGSVALNMPSAKPNMPNLAVLVPGDKACYNKTTGRMGKRQVTTGIYTAWIKGELVFRNMAFKNIIKKLERHYDISIDNNNIDLASEKFNASFRKNEPVEKVMGYFKELHDMNYTITNNKITIKPALPMKQ